MSRETRVRSSDRDCPQKTTRQERRDADLRNCKTVSIGLSSRHLFKRRVVIFVSPKTRQKFWPRDEREREPSDEREREPSDEREHEPDRIEIVGSSDQIVGSRLSDRDRRIEIILRKLTDERL
jgi:hypothetical protein